MVWVFISFLSERDPISEFNNFKRVRLACQRLRLNLAQDSFLSTHCAPTRGIVRVHFFTMKWSASCQMSVYKPVLLKGCPATLRPLSPANPLFPQEIWVFEHWFTGSWLGDKCTFSFRRTPISACLMEEKFHLSQQKDFKYNFSCKVTMVVCKDFLKFLPAKTWA